MIYVSSSCVKGLTIRESLQKLIDHGIKNIELSGGTKYYAGFADDILELKEKYSLNLLCHNYFPPPKEDFVLNVASLDDDINDRSVNHVKTALDLSEQLGSTKFAFHAGFLISIPVNEIGKSINSQNLFDRELAMNRFIENLDELRNYANKVEVYVENNVLSDINFRNFNRINPFFLTDSSDLQVLHKLNIKPLLDIAHLKVSCKTLGLKFEDEIQKFSKLTDYIHISDNDGLTDSNQELTRESEMYKVLETLDLKGKTFTIEVYTGLKDVLDSVEILEELINGK